MAKGISLHIGINRLNPDNYTLDDDSAWEGPLDGCEKDVDAMLEIAQLKKFKPTVLKTKAATADRVIEEIRSASEQLETGDIFLLTYSGHGGQVPDLNGDEPDLKDETWCLFDRMFLDDERAHLFAEFDPGVRIVILSDSCHSGSTDRGAEDPIAEPISIKVRAIPRGTSLGVYRGNRLFYNRIQRDLGEEPEIRANTILISACQDTELAADGDENGQFTGALKKVWNGGLFDGNYEQFKKDIEEELKRDYELAVTRAGGNNSELAKIIKQTPNFRTGDSPDPEFLEQRPFSI